MKQRQFQPNSGNSTSWSLVVQFVMERITLRFIISRVFNNRLLFITVVNLLQVETNFCLIGLLLSALWRWEILDMGLVRADCLVLIQISGLVLADCMVLHGC